MEIAVHKMCNLQFRRKIGNIGDQFGKILREVHKVLHKDRKTTGKTLAHLKL